MRNGDLPLIHPQEPIDHRCELSYLYDFSVQVTVSMIYQLWKGRPSNPILIAISGVLLLIFVLFASSSSVAPSRHFGSKSPSLSALDDIFNSTLGVSLLIISRLVSICKILANAPPSFVVPKNTSRWSPSSYRPPRCDDTFCCVEQHGD